MAMAGLVLALVLEILCPNVCAKMPITILSSYYLAFNGTYACLNFITEI